MKLIALAVGWVMIAANLFAQPQNSSSAAGKFKNTQELIDFLASEAVKGAEPKSPVHLDYSVESSRSVENVLGELHSQYGKNPSSVAVRRLAFAYGAYVREMIRKAEKNVSWQAGDAVGGEKSPPLVSAGGHTYPMAWCYRRIIDGDSDNVWIKYKALKERASNPSPGAKK